MMVKKRFYVINCRWEDKKEGYTTTEYEIVSKKPVSVICKILEEKHRLHKQFRIYNMREGNCIYSI